MFDDDLRFYQEEKLKFNELLNKLGWTEENLSKEVGELKESFERKKICRNF